MRIAVVGGGPIGLETAAEAIARGHEAVVYEADRVGAHVRQWGHVRMFSPWAQLVTPRGRSLTGLSVEDPDAGCPTGAELVERYLEPLAEQLVVREHTRVLEVGRTLRRKRHDPVLHVHADEPFRIVVRTPDGPDVEHAHAVIDCSGVLGQPAPIGAGGLEAPGEAATLRAGRLRQGPVSAADLSGRRVLLVGAGASAATVLAELLELEATPVVHWVTPRRKVPDFPSPVDDPLPARAELFAQARRALEHPRLSHHPGALVERLYCDRNLVLVTLTDGTLLEVDDVLACTGFRPDPHLARELHFPVDWATEVPVELAAALSKSSGEPPRFSASALRTPEPRFLVLGAKSYGRRSDFQLTAGHAQVLAALDLLEQPGP